MVNIFPSPAVYFAKLSYIHDFSGCEVAAVDFRVNLHPTIFGYEFVGYGDTFVNRYALLDNSVMPVVDQLPHPGRGQRRATDPAR